MCPTGAWSRSTGGAEPAGPARGASGRPARALVYVGYPQDAAQHPARLSGQLGADGAAKSAGCPRAAALCYPL